MEIMEEIFRDIEGYENLYQISNKGNVKSLRFGKEKILKPNKEKNGYLRVVLSKEEKLKHYSIHRLVAQAFLPNPDNLPEVNHKDEDKINNTIQNLEWCDHKHNNNYGTHNQRVAESNTNNPKLSKLVLCVETGLIYPSIREVERELGFANGYISKCCSGKTKTAYGYTWRYVQ